MYYVEITRTTGRPYESRERGGEAVVPGDKNRRTTEPAAARGHL